MSACSPFRVSILRRLTAWLCALLLAAPASAQAPAQTPPPAKQEPPVLRVTTHLVQVSVIVQDKKGEPVAGLTKDDFSILDRGQPQTISTFSVVSVQLQKQPTEPPH